MLFMLSHEVKAILDMKFMETFFLLVYINSQKAVV